MMNALNKPTILIVDDDIKNSELVSHILGELNYRVLSFHSIQDAIEILDLVLPNLVLLNIKLFDLKISSDCRFLQEFLANQNIPIIFMTDTLHTERHSTSYFTFFDYITKPCNQEEIIYKVNFNLSLRLLISKVQEQNRLLNTEITKCHEVQNELHEKIQTIEQLLSERETKISSIMLELKKNKNKLLDCEQTIKNNHFFDALTGLPNRAWLMERLETIIKLESQKCDFFYAVLSIGLDRFKIVNDCFGHLFGDQLLKKVGTRLQSCLLDRGTVTRFSGDEFIIVLDRINSVVECISIAESIQDIFKIPFQLNDYEIFSGVSIGITFSTMGYHSPIEILRDAGIAMSQAKEAGKGRYEVLTAETRTKAIARLQIENDLRQAIALSSYFANEQQEFYLEYQPIYSLFTGEIQGFEALIRWHHPLRGRVPPCDFIPIAEEIGSIDRLGYWVLKEATKQLKAWQKMFPTFSSLTMNVNISAKQLKQRNLLDEIEIIFSEVDLSSKSLKLEITESCFLEISNREIQILEDLKALGIGLCIDDFGTGYSSLSRLHKFPMDTIKVDRSFVKRLSRGSRETEIMQTIGNLGRNLGLSLVAEGIETSDQLQKLQDLGYEFGQGYLFSKPLDGKMATELLDRFSLDRLN